MPAAAKLSAGRDGCDLVRQFKSSCEGVTQTGGAPFLLAVSGGSDSLALLHLFARWLENRAMGAVPASVATVDHGLRPEAAAEADFVARSARELGLRHDILRWARPVGTKASQQNAREARYRLLADHAQAIGAKSVFLGHTQDDQLETMRMRLRRLEDANYASLGTAGMSPEIVFDGVRFVRPLLECRRSSLRDWLSGKGMGQWVEDPTNNDARYERIQIRHRKEAVSDGRADEALLRMQAAARRWRILVEQQSLAFARRSTDPGRHHIRVPAAEFGDLPEAVQRFVLGAAIGVMGGAGRRADGAALVRDVRALVRDQTGFAMNGAVVSHRRKAEILIYPEVRDSTFAADETLLEQLGSLFHDLPFEVLRAIAWRVANPTMQRLDWATRGETELFCVLGSAKPSAPAFTIS